MSKNSNSLLLHCFLLHGLLTISFTTFAEDSQSRDTYMKEFESQENPANLLELYTSQGCSSCPPAERWISNFKHDQRLWKTIFPLAFHVDYWDYIGWKDEFAEPEYGSRQRLYQRLGHIRQVATPGFVYGGKGWNGWFRGQRLPNEWLVDGLGKLTLSLSGQDAVINYQLNPQEKHKLSDDNASIKFNIALLGFDIQSDIDAGENRGRRLKQDFVVLSFYSAYLLDNPGDKEAGEMWNGRARIPSAAIENDAKMALVTWVSKGKDPRPIQVTGGWL